MFSLTENYNCLNNTKKNCRRSEWMEKKLETSVEILTHEIPISRISYNFNLYCLLAAKLNVINSQL